MEVQSSTPIGEGYDLMDKKEAKMPNKGKHWIVVSCSIVGVALICFGVQNYARLQAAAGTGQNNLCAERLINGGFETNEAWSLPVTPYSAAYSTEQMHSGARSLRAGIVNAADNVFSYSTALQTVQIPTGTQTTLTFWWY